MTLLETCQKIAEYVANGDPAKDVIEQSGYTESELLYELVAFYLNINEQTALPPEDDCESPFDYPNDPDPLRERS